MPTAAGEDRCHAGCQLAARTPVRTIIGDEDEADGRDVQASDCEESGWQRTVWVLPPPLRCRHVGCGCTLRGAGMCYNWLVQESHHARNEHRVEHKLSQIPDWRLSCNSCLSWVTGNSARKVMSVLTLPYLPQPVREEVGDQVCGASLVRRPRAVGAEVALRLVQREVVLALRQREDPLPAHPHLPG